MRKRLPQIAVGLVFALVAGSTAGLLYSSRDYLFEWSWAKTHGRFEETVPLELTVAVRDYAELRRPGEACVAKPFGKDDRYVFVSVGCGKFADAGKAPTEGDAAMVPSRFRYSGDRVSSWEEPEKGAFENSVRRLFPVAAYERIRYGVPHAEYWAAGAARMRAMAAQP